MRSAPQSSSPLSPCLSGASGFLNVLSRRPPCSHCQFPPYNTEAFNTFPFNLLPPLCPLLATPILCFQSLTASFPKHPGVGYPPAVNFVFRFLIPCPFVFTTFRVPFPATPLYSHPYKNPGGVGVAALPNIPSPSFHGGTP